MNNQVNSNSQGYLYLVSPRGYSAYEIAVQNGFEGTEEEWLESLNGYTPVRGTDYYTAEDIADMENDVKTAVEQEIPDVSSFITKDVNNLTYYTLKTNTGSLIDLSINTSTYVITLSLKDIDGNVISTDTIDLPLESVVVGGSYDSTNQKIVLTLQNGNTVDIPVGGLVSGLQAEITSQNKLSSDLVDDTNSGHKFVTASEKSSWNGKQDALTFDNTPTINSNNPVKSGGVYTALAGKVNTADVEEKDLLVTYEDTTTETLKLVVYK